MQLLALLLLRDADDSYMSHDFCNITRKTGISFGKHESTVISNTHVPSIILMKALKFYTDNFYMFLHHDNYNNGIKIYSFLFVHELCQNVSLLHR